METTKSKGYKPNQEKIARAKQRREELKQLSNELRKGIKTTSEQAPSLNSLLKKHYSEHNGTTELKTFEEWKKEGYIVKKGEQSFLIWGTPVEKTDNNITIVFFPIKHLFDKKQVHKIEKSNQ